MEGVLKELLKVAFVTLSVTLQASFLAAVCGTFPTKAEPTVDSYRIFLVNERHNRCTEQGVTEDWRGAVAGVQGNGLVSLREDYYVGKTK